MRLVSLTANDPRFRTVNFQPGMNILVAEREEDSTAGESRNGTGKTSLVLLLRWMLGGSIPKALRGGVFEGWEFRLELQLPGISLAEESVVVVRRTGSPQTRLRVEGWTRLPPAEGGEVHIDEWRKAQAEALFSLPEERPRELTVPSLWAYLIRTSFTSPTRVNPTDADWIVGTKVGYLLGLSPSVTARAGEVVSLERQQRAVNQAISEGALAHLQLDEAELRSQLAGAIENRNSLAAQIESFTVDREYEANEKRANALTRQIRDINERILLIDDRISQLERSVVEEQSANETGVVTTDLERLERAYRELGVVLPEAVTRRFDEVENFHQSVVRNRVVYLSGELDSLRRSHTELVSTRSEIDGRRSSVLEILQSSVASETFTRAQIELAEARALIADLERRLETAASVAEYGDRIESARIEANRSARQELADRQDFLVSVPLTLFRQLGSEVYTDRTADLLVRPGKNGGVTIQPSLSGDQSDGIRSVETFLLDMVMLLTALSLSRSPSLLVHDSHLFDAVDHRQVASCFNIGARLAEANGFQYVVAMNSDFLASVEREGAFDSGPYQLETRLSDAKSDGGLFGFDFG